MMGFGAEAGAATSHQFQPQKFIPRCVFSCAFNSLSVSNFTLQFGCGHLDKKETNRNWCNLFAQIFKKKNIYMCIASK